MSEGGKMIPNNLSFLSSFSVLRGCPKYYLSSTFDTNAGAIDRDSNTGEYQYGGTSNYKYNLEYSIIKR